jgi:hypothetical protein
MLLGFNEGFLWASLIWGSVGTGYLVYGSRQKSAFPFLGGLGMIVASYLIDSWWQMSLVAIALIAATHWLLRREFF